MNGRRSVQRLRPSRRLRPVGARRGTSMVEVLVYVLCVAMLTNIVAMVLIAVKQGTRAATSSLAHSQILERMLTGFRRDAHQADAVTRDDGAAIELHGPAGHVRYEQVERRLKRTLRRDEMPPEIADWEMESGHTMQFLVDPDGPFVEMRQLAEGGRIVWRVVADIGRNRKRGWSEP